MNLVKPIELMEQVVDALEVPYPEKALNIKETYLNPAKTQIPCKMKWGDVPLLNKMAPKTTVFSENSLITRYQPGQVDAAVQSPDHVNLLEVRTQALKECQAEVHLNFSLSSHIDYAINAATVDAVAKPSDIFVLAKTGLLMEDEIKTLHAALPRFQKLDPERELPLIYLHVAKDDESPEEAEAQFTANMHILEQVPGGVTKAFKCDSLDGADKGYQAYIEFWGDLAAVQRNLFLQPVCDAFIKEVTDLREALRLREKHLSDEYQSLAHIDEQTYKKLVHELERINGRDYLLAPSREWQDFVETKKHQINLEFIDNGNGEPTVHEVALEDMDALPKDGDSAVWDEFRVSKSIEVKEAYAGLMKAGCVDLEARYTGLRHNACEEISGVIKAKGIELPKALEEEILRLLAEVKMRRLSPANLTSAADKIFRYSISTSFCTSIGISTAAGIAYLMAALKSGAAAAAPAGAPLGPPAIILCGIIGAGAGVLMAHFLVKSQDQKAFRNEWTLKMTQFLRVLSTQAQFAVRQLGIEYERLLMDDLMAIRGSVNDIVAAYQKMSPEEIETLREQTQAVVTKLDDLLDSSGSENDDSENDDSENGDSENDNNVRD